MLGQLDTLEVVVLAILGVLLLLFGYRIKKIAFFLVWFVLGFNLTRLLLPMINDAAPQIANDYWWQSLLPVGGGLLLALLGFSIEKICVAGICFALVMVVTVQYFGTDIQTLAIGGVIGVLAAGAATALMKPATIVATAAVGAYALTLVIFWLFEGIDYGIFYWPLIIGLTAVGSLVQFSTTKHVH